jgi:dTMP kinase
MNTRRGRFITLEGVDGAGKSTHTEWIAETLRERGLQVVVSREPGGTPLGEKLRELLLTEAMGLRAETLLMFAARAEHLRQTLLPALQSGSWVVCDRFTDATYAYQGGGRELGAPAIHALEQWVHPGFYPDLTLLFDVPLEVARERLADAREPDRFEREGAAFFERVRAAYRQRADKAPGRFHIVDATRSIEAIREGLAARLRAMVDTAE